MIIPISTTVRLRSENKQWVIDRRAKGKKKWNEDTYHMNPNSALASACHGDIRRIPDALKFEIAIKEMKQITRKYTRLQKALPK